jgi:hypothetical protein
MKHPYRTHLASRVTCAIVGAVSLISGSAWAEGSVSFTATVLPLIKARPTFEKFVTDTFEITDTGWGIRIGNEAMPHLGGARMGPYEFQAAWHNRNGDVPVTIVVDTDIKFFDRKGREITNGQLRNATSFKETFRSIEIEPPQR